MLAVGGLLFVIAGLASIGPMRGAGQAAAAGPGGPDQSGDPAAPQAARAEAGGGTG